MPEPTLVCHLTIVEGLGPFCIASARPSVRPPSGLVLAFMVEPDAPDSLQLGELIGTGSFGQVHSLPFS